MNNTILGTVQFGDFEPYKNEWLSRECTWSSSEKVKEELQIVAKADRDDATLLRKWFGGREIWWQRELEDNLNALSAFLDYLKQYGQPANVYGIYEGIGMVVGVGNARFFLYHPDSLIAGFTPVKDYSEMSVGEIRAIAGKGAISAVPATAPDTLSVAQVRDTVAERKAEIEEIRRQYEDAKEGRSAELAALKEEADRAIAALNAKKESLMAMLDEKREILQEQVEAMNNQIFLLEAQIYAIRCYMGEVINFARLREGRNAPDSEPIVLYQKLRYLEDEMGRLASVYSLDFSELRYFEEFLAVSPLALETFAPSERCVALVRLSKTGQRLCRSEKYDNMLESYSMYHGNTVGIIIRNGENVYIGWTDPEEVHVTEDFIMNIDPKDFRVNTDYVGQESDAERKSRIRKERTQAKEIVAEMASRIFVFNILQGIVDNSDILPLPEGVRISKSSEYVVFSMADRWLVDNRFGSFADIIKRCNGPEAKRGDDILTILNLMPIQKMRYRAWSNDRGRGEKNRTHDCTVDDCAIYPINLVEHDEPRQRTYYRYRYDGLNGNNWINCVTDGDGSRLSENSEILKTKWESDPHFFVSVEKENSGYFSEKKARANFEVYTDEFINLTFMNSEWLMYAINTRNLGGWVIGGETVNYAYGIRYLNKALEYIRGREAEELAIIEAKIPGYAAAHPSWMLALSEWKIENDIHRLTSRNVSAFLKSAN